MRRRDRRVQRRRCEFDVREGKHPLVVFRSIEFRGLWRSGLIFYDSHDCCRGSIELLHVPKENEIRRYRKQEHETKRQCDMSAFDFDHLLAAASHSPQSTITDYCAIISVLRIASNCFMRAASSKRAIDPAG